MDREKYVPPRSHAETFGEDLGVDPFVDAGPSLHPDDRSSAARHARIVKSREQAAAERRDLAVIARAAAEQEDDRALERAQDLLRRGQKVPPGVRIQAARAANRAGGAIPTAQIHAARALAGRRPTEES